MADFGSNFTEAFSATYGLGLKRKQIEGEEKRAAAAEKRAQESHDAQMAEYRLKETMRGRLGTAGNVLDNPADQTGLLSADDYNALKTPKPTAALKTPDVTMGAPKAAALPQDKAMAQEAPAAMALPMSGEAKPEAKPQENYVPVMVGNNIMYAPAARVKKLQGPELIRAQAEAIGTLDPVVGAQLVQSANAIEGQNLELNSKRYAQGVLNAMRTAENDLDAGLGMLRDAYNQGMPDLGNVEFTRQKDGGIKVANYVDTAGGRKMISSRVIPAKDPETGLTAKENLFRYALSLGSPDAFRQNIIDSSTLATQTLQRVLSVRQDRREEAQLGISRARLDLDRKIAANESGGQSFNAATLQKVQVGKNEDGEPIYGQVQVRSAKKGGGMQQLVSIPEGDFWLPFGSNGYDYNGAYREMRNYAAKKGYGMGVNSEGFYMQKSDGTKIPMNRSDLQRYRFGK